MACLLLTGCSGMEVLEEIPGEFGLYRETKEQERESEISQSRESVPVLGEQTAEATFLMDEAGKYGFRCLSAAEQIWYRDIEKLLGSFAESGELSPSGLEAGLDESRIDKIFQCVLVDHPELFFVEGYSYTKYSVGGEVTSIEFSGTYNVDRETAVKRSEEIAAQVQAILSGIDSAASEYDKVKYVYDTIIANTEYQADSADNQNIYSVFIHNLSVCQGYAKATQYLLNKLGVECTLVLGEVEPGEGHAWNLVKVDGSYYFVDTTWGDASYQTEDGENGGRDFATINYDYLNVTTRELLKTHTIGGEVPMPACVATDANYYVREGLLFTSYDRDRMSQLFQSRWDGGYGNVTVKCSDEECYSAVKKALIEDKEIFDYLQDRKDTVAFSTNDKQLSLTFWVTNE